MQVQAATDYAIRILNYLHSHDKELPTAMTISQATGVSYPFFTKVASQLKQSGLLDTVQGRNGGFILARPATEISIYDVFQAIEGKLYIKRCLKDKRFCNKDTTSSCSAHDYFLALQNDIIVNMSRKYIADFS